jgi:phosphatidylglycerol---prolipoprotein diacylglyceryl transferase
MIRDPILAHQVHAAFEAAALAIGARYYFWLRRRAKEPGVMTRSGYAVTLGCLTGAAIGNKLVFWLEMPQLWNLGDPWFAFFLGGQSVVGGLLGGWLGVEIAKACAGIQVSTGDRFVYPILLGLIIGRVGCFLAGLHDGTYGTETSLPWGVDHGDGILRHPVQIYEIIFVAALWRALHRASAAIRRWPGLQFKLMLGSYLAWRIGIDCLKPVIYPYALGLSGIQWICIIGLLLDLLLVLRLDRRPVMAPVAMSTPSAR